MKLETSIKMRADGTVLVHGLDKKDYTFSLDAQTGMVVCDIEHKETLAHLLSLGGFCPADETDHELAASLIEQEGAAGADDAHDLDDDDADEVNPDALPIEAATPPAPRKRKAKAE